MWTRSDPIRQNRECVIPDISRTFHFGARGLNMNVYFQEVYFQKHALNTLPNVKLKDVDTWVVKPFQRGDRIYTSVSDVCRRQILKEFKYL